MTGNTFEVSVSRWYAINTGTAWASEWGSEPAAVATPSPVRRQVPQGSWGPSDSLLLDAWLSSQQ